MRVHHHRHALPHLVSWLFVTTVTPTSRSTEKLKVEYKVNGVQTEDGRGGKGEGNTEHHNGSRFPSWLTDTKTIAGGYWAVNIQHVRLGKPGAYLCYSSIRM